jgi:signal peptidase I
MAFEDDDKTFYIGDLVIVEKTTYGLSESIFSKKFKPDTKITYNDNILIKENSIGMVVGFIANWVVPAAIVSFANIKNGQRIVLTYNKINSVNNITETNS